MLLFACVLIYGTACIASVSICSGAQYIGTLFRFSSAIGSGITHMVMLAESIHPCFVCPIRVTL